MWDALNSPSWPPAFQRLHARTSRYRKWRLDRRLYSPKSGQTDFVARAWSNIGVPGSLPNTTIELHNSQGQLIESNAGWKNGETPVARPNGSSVSPTYLDIYHLTPPNDDDSARYNQLAPGNYTVIFKSPTGATGNGLAEIYNVDP